MNSIVQVKQRGKHESALSYRTTGPDSMFQTHLSVDMRKVISLQKCAARSCLIVIIALAMEEERSLRPIELQQHVWKFVPT